MDAAICVPLRFSMGDGTKGIVITGPNTGGKTVALKTVVLNCMMAQCGLHVPCKEAQVCMHSNFLCDIGDGQNISENLSTFSAHITNVLDILTSVSEQSLHWSSGCKIDRLKTWIDGVCKPGIYWWNLEFAGISGMINGSGKVRYKGWGNYGI